MSEAAAHTAEHIFVGILSKTQPSLSIHKVEFGKVNSVSLDIESLSWNAILEAEIAVNKAISESRPVRIHTFRTLEEAEQQFRTLRSRDDRIRGRVRVVEVEGYDCAACTGQHVSNTAECSYFLVSRLSRSGGSVKVEFLVGERARTRALELSKMCFRTAEVLSANVEELEKKAESLKLQNHTLRKRLRRTTDEVMRRILPKKRVSFEEYSACLEGVDEKTVMERAGEIIERNPRALVIFAVKNESTRVILGRGEELPFDSREILKNALGIKGFRGGGRANFAFGTVTEEVCSEDLSKMSKLAEIFTRA